MTNGEAVIAKLISEITDLTKANRLLHGIVSNREEEISGLRALSESHKRAAQMALDTLSETKRRLASARKALKMFVQRVELYGNWDDGCFYYGATSASELQEPLALAKAELEQGQK